MNIPKQKISDKEKTEDWSRDTIDAVIEIALANNDKEDIKKYYLAAAGVLDQSDYNYFLNPYNTDVERLKRFKRKLRNYDIILPIIKRYVGEYIKTIFDVTITCENSDSHNKFLENLQEKVIGKLNDIVNNTLNSYGINTGIPTTEVQDIAQFVEVERLNWKDERALVGQEAFNFFKKELELLDKFIEAVYHWIVADEVYSYRSVYMDDLNYEIVHPLEAYPLYNNETYVEDMDGFVRVYSLSPNQILDKFRGLDIDIDELLDRLEVGDITSDTAYKNLVSLSTDSFDGIRAASAVGNLKNFKEWAATNVYHVQYLGYKHIKKLTYLDPLGLEQETEVSIDYKLNKEIGDIKVTNVWVNQVLEGWRIGEKGNAFYIHLKPTIIQRNDLNNSSDVKLNYNGVLGTFKFGGNTSIVKILMPYQALYNIFHANLEELINKNKHKLAVIPKGLIPDDDEMSPDEFFYRIKSDGEIIVDESAEGFALAVQAIKVLDVSLSDTIKDMIGLLSFIKQEAWQAVEMNDQRFGDIATSAAVSNTNEAIVRSSMGSVPMFKTFETFKLKDIQALLDYSKFAWINVDPTTSLGSYVTSDNRVAYFKVNAKDYLETNFGVFASNDPSDLDDIKFMKQLLQPMMQNQQELLAIELLQAKSMATIKRIIKKYKDIQNKQAQAAQEAEANKEQQKAATEKYKIDKASEDNKYVADKNYESNIDGKLIDLEKTAMMINTGGGTKDGDGDGKINEINSKVYDDTKLKSVIDRNNSKVLELKNKQNKTTN